MINSSLHNCISNISKINENVATSFCCVSEISETEFDVLRPKLRCDIFFRVLNDESETFLLVSMSRLRLNCGLVSVLILPNVKTETKLKGFQCNLKWIANTKKVTKQG